MKKVQLIIHEVLKMTVSGRDPLSIASCEKL